MEIPVEVSMIKVRANYTAAAYKQICHSVTNSEIPTRPRAKFRVQSVREADMPWRGGRYKPSQCIRDCLFASENPHVFRVRKVNCGLGYDSPCNQLLVVNNRKTQRFCRPDWLCTAWYLSEMISCQDKWITFQELRPQKQLSDLLSNPVFTC